MKRGPSPVLGASPYAKAVTRSCITVQKYDSAWDQIRAPLINDRDSDSDSAPDKRVGKCDRIRFTGADKTSNRFSCQAGITCTPPFFKPVHGACRVCREGYELATSGGEYRTRLLNRAALRASPAAPSRRRQPHFANVTFSRRRAIDLIHSLHELRHYSLAVFFLNGSIC